MDYTSVKIPKPLSEQIKHICPMFGFTSVSDFVINATRSQLREYNNMDTKEKLQNV